MLNELIDSSAKCYHIIECNNNTNNMANDINETDISVSINVRLNKQFINRETTDEDNHSPNHSIKCNQSDRSVETIVQKCISLSTDIMKQKSKQILICLVLAIIVTLLAALHDGYESYDFICLIFHSF